MHGHYVALLLYVHVMEYPSAVDRSRDATRLLLADRPCRMGFGVFTIMIESIAS